MDEPDRSTKLHDLRELNHA